MTHVEPAIDIARVERLFSRLHPNDDTEFARLEEAAIRYQRIHNPIYNRFHGFRYLPIDAFKQSDLTCFPVELAEAVFRSSGTGDGNARSTHYVRYLDVYRRSVLTHFELIFGSGPFFMVGCLPGTKDISRHSSLFRMIQLLIDAFGAPGSGIVGPHRQELVSMLGGASKTAPLNKRVRVLIFGLAFALLDVLETGSIELPLDALVIETGGMKSHRRELGRQELHTRLAAGFGIPLEQVTSEYGMCELLSQFYMRADGLFYPPPWVRFKIFDTERPEREVPEGEAGALAIIDLANLYSVSSILTKDSAIRRGDGFELLGRLTGAELRGCNFLLDSLS